MILADIKSAFLQSQFFIYFFAISEKTFLPAWEETEKKLNVKKYQHKNYLPSHSPMIILLLPSSHGETLSDKKVTIKIVLYILDIL